MINFVDGEVVHRDKCVFTLINHGWGVEIELAQKTDVLVGNRYRVFTVLHWGIQKVNLYGFLDQSARYLFVRLLDTPTIGINIALRLMRTVSIVTIIRQIKAFNFAFFAQLGIRQFTPNRILTIVFQLQKWYGETPAVPRINVSVVQSLLKMGYELPLIFQSLTHLYQDPTAAKPTVDALMQVLNQQPTDH